MGRTTTLLEGLCGQALSLGADSIEVEHKDSREWVFANKGGMGIGIANYESSSADGKTLRGNLYAAAKKPVRTVIGGAGLYFQSSYLREFWRGYLRGKHKAGTEPQIGAPWSATSRISAAPERYNRISSCEFS